MAESGEIKACRLCLVMGSELFSIDNQLETSMKSILGQNISYDSGLPKYACEECTAFLVKFKKFREKCLIAQTVLYSILKNTKKITDRELRKLNRKRLKLDLADTPPPTPAAPSPLQEGPSTTIKDELPIEIEQGHESEDGFTNDDPFEDEENPLELRTGEETNIKDETDASEIFSSTPNNTSKNKHVSREVHVDPCHFCAECGVQYSTEAAWRHHIDKGHYVADSTQKCISRRPYPLEHLKQAFDAVTLKGMRISRAAALFKVPRTTLQCTLKNGVVNGRRGPTPIFGKDEEVLVNYVVKEGILNPKLVILKAKQLAKKLKKEHCFKAGTPGIRWYYRFINRHPELKQYALKKSVS